MTESLKALELRRATERLADVFADVVRELLSDTSRRPAERVARVATAVKELEGITREKLLPRGPGRPSLTVAAANDVFIMPYVQMLHMRAATRRATKEARELSERLAASTSPAAPYVKQLLEGGDSDASES